MPRNGTATKAAEPNELYDSLSPESQQIWDEIGSNGYKPEKGAAGLWFARKAGQEPKDAIGPCDHISVLLTLVKDQVAKDGPPPASDETPSTRLPGMEEPAIEELDKLGDECILAKEKRDQAKTVFDDACDRMREKMREHDRKRYNRRGFSLVIEDTEKLVIKKAEQSGPKQPSTKKKNKGLPFGLAENEA